MQIVAKKEEKLKFVMQMESFLTMYLVTYKLCNSVIHSLA